MKHCIQYLLALAILLMVNDITKAQAPKTYSSSELLLQMKKLKVLGSVLYIAAHPDDENTRLLSWLANEKLYRAGYLSLTRGDGGQNLIGDEQGIDLGLIRTQELLAARNIDGAEQFFTRAYDFGYCKQPNEALAKWGHEEILSDVVRVIRIFKPDVIICRFPTTGEGGHGHHTASAILAEEAFEAAADPKRFPEQIIEQGLQPWKAERLLWNTFNFGSNNTQKEDQFKIDVGGYNPLLGKSYGEMAAQSRSMHKSQGFGVPSQRGPAMEYFVTLKGSSPQKELIENTTTDWSRIGSDILNQFIDSITSHYHPEHPEASLAGLMALSTAINQLNVDSFWKKIKQQELAQLILHCGGLWMEAISTEEKIVLDDSFHFTYAAIDRGQVQWDSIVVQGCNRSFRLIPAKNKLVNATENDLLPKKLKRLTQPYWLTEPMKSDRFEVKDVSLIGTPENKALTVGYTLYKNGQSWHYAVPVRYKYTDPVKGEFWQPITIIPAMHIESESAVLLAKKGETPVIQLKVNAHRSNTLKRLINITNRSDNWVLEKNIPVKKGDQKLFPIPSNEGSNLLYADDKDSSYHLQLHTIRYDHIPPIHYTTSATVNRVSIPVTITKNKIGYIEGAGDKVMESLRQIGYDVTLLKKEDITGKKLTNYGTIITGVRAYNTNEWLNEVYDTLMNYIQSGGTLLVQYNTSNSLGPLKSKIGPYPFNISRKRVTDENAIVTFKEPASPMFQFPNKIGPKDFDGWIQERSIYHASDWDSHYKTLFSMNDQGESADEGSLIYCKYGKGTFIYTGLVFFRELPAGVAGAFKLMANLIK